MYRSVPTSVYAAESNGDTSPKLDLSAVAFRSPGQVIKDLCVISVINDCCLVLSCILFITLLTLPRLDHSAVGRILDKVIKVLCDYSI